MLDKEAKTALFGISSDLHILQKVKFSFNSIISPINNFLHQMMKRAFPLHHMRQTGFYCLVSHFGSVEKQIADKWTAITAICFRQSDLWNVFVFSGVFLQNGIFDGPKLWSWTFLTWFWKLNATDPFSQSVWFLCFPICGTNFWSGDYLNFEI